MGVFSEEDAREELVYGVLDFISELIGVLWRSTISNFGWFVGWNSNTGDFIGGSFINNNYFGLFILMEICEGKYETLLCS